ncbi:hypothetical protein [Pacificispira sp.]|uniref:hypothetical protein n=1 Tax=Pacificispira sp. TaxID=2888761 RepID=UPI003BAC1838
MQQQQYEKENVGRFIKALRERARTARGDIPETLRGRLDANRPASEIERAFFEFHRANPAVYAEFQECVRTLQAEGRTRYSASDIIGFLRWHFRALVDNPDRSGFKINNNHIRSYAMLATEDMELDEFFEFRESKAKPEPYKARKEDFE